MSDLTSLLGGMQPEGSPQETPPGDTGGQKKQDKNKPVPWVPRKKTTGLADVKKAVENEQWDQAFKMFTQLDEKSKKDPVAKQIAQLLMNKMGISPVGASPIETP